MTSFHKQAFKAAEAAHCAGEQEKFWQMRDQLFANQKALDPDDLFEYAKAIGLDMPKFQQCLDTGKYAEEIKKEIDEGKKAGLTGVPTFLIGHTDPDKPEIIKTIRIIKGVQPYSIFEKALDNLPESLESFFAIYSLSLQTVERPQKATQRYGPQKIDILSTNEKYKFYFEDNLVKILWIVTSRHIAFLLQNKTDHSIKIPWDEAAYVDETGRSHRLMHSGIKYSDRDRPIPQSVVVRKGILEDTIVPTDYISWSEGTKYSAGSWDEKPLLPDSDFHGDYIKGKYPTLEDFDNAVKSYIGKTIQVLLPLQIEDVINDYIFTFKIDSVSTFKK